MCVYFPFHAQKQCIFIALFAANDLTLNRWAAVQQPDSLRRGVRTLSQFGAIDGAILLCTARSSSNVDCDDDDDDKNIFICP